jgi:hypothetical protein
LKGCCVEQKNRTGVGKEGANMIDHHVQVGQFKEVYNGNERDAAK